MRELTQIAVGFDGSQAGLDALMLGELLALTLGSELVAVRVSDSSSADELAQVEAGLESDLASALRRSEVRRRAVVLGGGSPSKALSSLATREPEIGMIALGCSHRAGLGRFVPGGVAERLLAGSPCSIAVAPRGFAEPAEDQAPGGRLRVIGVGFDASPESGAALEMATRIAAAAEATLRVIAVSRQVPIGLETAPAAAGVPVSAPVTIDLQARLHDAVAELPGELRALAIYERGTPARCLLDRAEEGIDLLVMGSRGHGPVGSALLGTTSAEILRNACCAVVVVARPALGHGA